MLLVVLVQSQLPSQALALLPLAACLMAVVQTRTVLTVQLLVVCGIAHLFVQMTCALTSGMAATAPSMIVMIAGWTVMILPQTVMVD